MCNWLKRVFPLLLISAMAIIGIQSAMALDLNHSSQEEACLMMQHSVADTNNTEFGGECPMKQVGENHINTDCNAPCNITSPPTGEIQLTARYISQLRAPIYKGTILSHYPELFKRPPRA